VLSALVDRVTPQRIKYGKYTAIVQWTEIGETLRLVAAAVAKARVA
jgi:hypothetical protein